MLAFLLPCPACCSWLLLLGQQTRVDANFEGAAELLQGEQQRKTSRVRSSSGLAPSGRRPPTLCRGQHHNSATIRNYLPREQLWSQMLAAWRPTTATENGRYLVGQAVLTVLSREKFWVDMSCSCLSADIPRINKLCNFAQLHSSSSFRQICTLEAVHYVSSRCGHAGFTHRVEAEFDCPLGRLCHHRACHPPVEVCRPLVLDDVPED